MSGKIFPAVLAAVLVIGFGGVTQATEKITVDSAYPGLSTGILGAAVLETMDNGILLTADDWQVGATELMELVHKQDAKVARQLEKNLFFALEQEAMARALAGEARKAGITGDYNDQEQLMRQLFEEKAAGVTVTAEEIKTFYDANRDMFGAATRDSVAENIRQFLLQDKQHREFSSFLAQMKESLQFHVNAQWIEEQSVSAFDNEVDRARRSQKPTMVEFGATGCIPCDMMQPILDNLVKNHGDELNVVFVHVGEQQILAARYGISSIPVQVFFDARGREVFRHTGFFAEEEVSKQLVQLGVGQ